MNCRQGAERDAGAESMQVPSTERHHVHSSYIWLGGAKMFVFVVLIVVISDVSAIFRIGEQALGTGGIGTQDQISLAITISMFAIIICVSLIFTLRLLEYRHLWYELTPMEFNLHSGVITRKSIQIPYIRIQTLDQKATLFQRIFGLCSIYIYSAGGSANTAAVVPYLQRHRADQLCKELYARHAAAVEAEEEENRRAASKTAAPSDLIPQTDMEAPHPSSSPGHLQDQGNILDFGAEAWSQVGGVFSPGEAFTGAPHLHQRSSFQYGMTNGQLLMTGISNSTGLKMAFLSVLGILLQVALIVLNMYLTGGDLDVLHLPYIAANMTTLFFAAAVGILTLIVWMVVIAATCLQYGGFQARRVNDRIEVERGLLQHQTESVSIERVQSIVIEQSLVRKLIGYCEISLGRVSARNSQDGNSASSNPKGIVIHPFVKISEVSEIIHGLVPEIEQIPEVQVKLPGKALPRALIRRCFLTNWGFWAATILGLATIGLVMLKNDLGNPFRIPDVQFNHMMEYVNAICLFVNVVCMVKVVGSVFGSILWYKGSGFGTDRRAITILNDGLSKRKTIILKRSIQFGAIRSNPLQWIANTRTIMVRTASGAGTGGTTTKMVDAAKPDGEAYLEWLAS